MRAKLIVGCRSAGADPSALPGEERKLMWHPSNVIAAGMEALEASSRIFTTDHESTAVTLVLCGICCRRNATGSSRALDFPFELRRAALFGRPGKATG